MKTLQRRWTTFLKAELVCEDKPSGQRYNILTDVFTTQHTPGDPGSTHFYGLFTSQWYAKETKAILTARFPIPDATLFPQKSHGCG